MKTQKGRDKANQDTVTTENTENAEKNCARVYLKHQLVIADKTNFEKCEQDPLKQGLKHIPDISAANILKIREQDPLKQGLKHVVSHPMIFTPSNSRARSTKTRIETIDRRDDVTQRGIKIWQASKKK